MPPKKRNIRRKLKPVFRLQKGGNDQQWDPYKLPPHLRPKVIERQRKAIREYKPKWYEKGIVGEIKGNKIVSQLIKLVNNRAGNWVEQKGWGKK